MKQLVLIINCGSSSLKSSLFEIDGTRRLLTGNVDRIGLAGTKLTLTDHRSESVVQADLAAADHVHAVEQLLKALGQHIDLSWIRAVGERFVHGGPRFASSQVVNHDILAELIRLIPLDPVHLPPQIAVHNALAQRLPTAIPVACFDTAFHNGLPQRAQLLPIPRRYTRQGLRRFGFHGLSYEYLLSELERVAGQDAARGRVIFAHLGSGSSMSAVLNGKCIETTMGLTPASGLVMSTRSGDVDPGLVTYLMRTESLNADELDSVFNKQSGLLGISETSPDVRDLLSRAGDDERAAAAIEVFCYRAKQEIGALAAALGGLETLVFSAGIGEHSAEIRSRICAGLEFLGVNLDPHRNARNLSVISGEESPATVRIIKTDEEAVIFREVLRCMES